MNTYIGSGSFPRDIKHTIELTFQFDDFKGTVIYQIGGNCLGGTVLDCALSEIEMGEFSPNMKFPENQKHIELDDEGYAKYFKLFNPNGDELELECNEWDAHRCITGVKIINWEER